MKKGFLQIVFCLFVLPFVCKAQFDEVGTIFGCSNYSGDLTERDIEPLECNLANGIFVRRNLSSQLSLKLQFSRMVLSGNDANNTAEGGLWKRNLNFRSDLYEFAAQAEWVPISLQTGDNQFQPYLFTGLAAFYFNPQTEMNGKYYNLHHYQTEGVEYSQFQFAIPFGAGVRLNLRNRGSLGFEFGLRKTFTDYLDDVSNTYRSDLRQLGEVHNLAAQLSYRGIEEHSSDTPNYPKAGTKRGNPDKKDWYGLFGMTLAIKIHR
ncbi:MAG: outer membrane beta-barrel protein [Bacteroidetes bacterium]|nr:outer membrane beta-barrel protein [Bacteroidota bacterium]